MSSNATSVLRRDGRAARGPGGKTNDGDLSSSTAEAPCPEKGERAALVPILVHPPLLNKKTLNKK